MFRDILRDGGLHRRLDARDEAVRLLDGDEPDAVKPLDGGLDRSAGQVESVGEAGGDADLLERSGIDRVVRPAGRDHRGDEQALGGVLRQHLERGTHADLHAQHTEREDDGAPHRHDGEMVGVRGSGSVAGHVLRGSGRRDGRRRAPAPARSPGHPP